MSDSLSFRQVLWQAFKDTGPVGMGYLPLGLAYGAFAVSSGFPIWFTCLTAVVIYAGSMEFTAVSLILGGVGLAQIAVTTFFVNFRHIFYGITFPLFQIRSRLARLYAIHALTDEAYALTATYHVHEHKSKRSDLSAAGSSDENPPPGPVVFAITVLCHLYWITGVSLGAWVGNFLSSDNAFLSFALPALFLVLSIDAWRSTKQEYRYLAGVAFGLGILSWLISKPYLLVIALSLYTVTLVVLSRCHFRSLGERLRQSVFPYLPAANNPPSGLTIPTDQEETDHL